MAKKFVRTTSENFNNLSNKSQYKDSIVFIEDIKQIWSNNVYYGGITPIINVTYNDLTAMVDKSDLIPGQQYRIIDYEATTCQTGTMATNNYSFDIIVTALSSNELDKNAKASANSNSDSFYYYDKWEIKYTIDNYGDATLLIWADPNLSNYKGTIYYLKDDLGNECGFDWFNIQIDISTSLGYNTDLGEWDILLGEFYYQNSNLYVNTLEDGQYHYIFENSETNSPNIGVNNKITNFIYPDSYGFKTEFIPWIVITTDYASLSNINIENSTYGVIRLDFDLVYNSLSNITQYTALYPGINIKNSLGIYINNIYTATINNCGGWYTNDSLSIGGTVIINSYQNEINLQNNCQCIIMQNNSSYNSDIQYSSINIKNSNIGIASNTVFGRNINVKNVNVSDIMIPGLYFDESDIYDYQSTINVHNCYLTYTLETSNICNSHEGEYVVTSNSSGSLVTYNLADIFNSNI